MVDRTGGGPSPVGRAGLPPAGALWLVRQGCRIHSVDELMYVGQDRQLATILQSFAKSMGILPQQLPGAAKPLRESVVHRWIWLALACLNLMLLPVWIAVRALFAWLVTSPANKNVDHHPSVVLTGWYPNHVTGEGGRPIVTYWSRLHQQIEQKLPEVSVRYLLNTTKYRFTGWRRLIRPIYTGWGTLRKMPEVLPLHQCHPELAAWFRAVPVQWRVMCQLLQCEQAPEFRTALTFGETDVSCLFVPLLRRAVGDIAKWSRNVAAVTTSLRRAGDVRLVLVHEEFYPKGMLTIAAARSLGIRTIGVQHGTIGPEHTMYMVPRGQLDGAPVPDLFAAWGEFAADVLCHVGAFPHDRLSVVGAPRLDAWASSQLPGSEARDRLGFAADDVVILFTSEGFALSQSVVRGLLEVARAQPEWRIVIKVHPNDRSPDAYQRLMSAVRVTNMACVRGALAEHMAACDVLVSGASTTVLEALLCGKAVVSANFPSEPDRYPYVAEGVAVGARSPAELESAIQQALWRRVAPAARRQFLLRHLGPTADARR